MSVGLQGEICPLSVASLQIWVYCVLFALFFSFKISCYYLVISRAVLKHNGFSLIWPWRSWLGFHPKDLCLALKDPTWTHLKDLSNDLGLVLKVLYLDSTHWLERWCELVELGVKWEFVRWFSGCHVTFRCYIYCFAYFRGHDAMLVPVGATCREMYWEMYWDLRLDFSLDFRSFFRSLLFKFPACCCGRPLH